MSLHWVRTTDHSWRLHDAGGEALPWHVSHTLVNGGDHRYSAWHGPLLSEVGRGGFPQCLAISDDPAEARALCEQHAERTLSEAQAA